MKKILLLGSGELGKEFVIAAKRAGQYVIACDRYNDAPAMQVADEREVFSMLDGDALEAVVKKHQPDIIVPGHSGGAQCSGRQLYHEQKGYPRSGCQGTGIENCQIFLCQDL